jgi:crotonobetaine/carnitine-CoA ligase
MERTIDPYLLRAALERPDDPFVMCGGPWLTFAQVDDMVDRVACGLHRLGVGKGDRVAMILPTREETIGAMFGCFRIGAVEVPLNYYLKGEFLRYQLNDCGANVLITDDAGYRAAEPLLDQVGIEHVVLVDPIPSDAKLAGRTRLLHYSELIETSGALAVDDITQHDLCAIIYTSGTTGYPKGCMLSHGYFTVAAHEFGRQLIEPGDRIFGVNPLFHNSGQIWMVMNALVSGVSVCIEPVFKASEFMRRASEVEATVVLTLGSMAMAILAQPESPEDTHRRFRPAMVIPMTPGKQKEFERRFNTPVSNKCFGQTEFQPGTLGPFDENTHTAGIPVPYLDMKVVDDMDHPVPTGEVGEIVVRPLEPDVMFAGYWNAPDATVEAFRNLWYHTGDYGVIDERGHLTFIDRKKDALRRRGENVSSFELEAAIMRNPKISMVGVCAVPSALAEDDIKACIVCHDDQTVTPDELFEYFKNNLPYFMIPRYVEVRASLPLTVTGRVRKAVLREEGLTADTWDLETMGLVVAKSDRR